MWTPSTVFISGPVAWLCCSAMGWTLIQFMPSLYICELLAMPIKVAPVRHVPNEAEREHANNYGYRHRCPSTTDSYKVLQSLMFSSTLMGSMGWRDFSKAGCRVLVTKSTVYGFVVQAFLSINVIRWCLIVSAEDQFNLQLIFKLVIITWALETLSHSIGFFIASINYKRLPEFLFEWDKLRSECVHSTASLKKQTDICTGVVWLLVSLNTTLSGYLMFNSHMQDDTLYPLKPDDEPYKFLVVKIINLVTQTYLIFASTTPSFLLFTVTNSLAWEFNHNTKNIRDLRNNYMADSLESTRKHHQKLCNLIDHADDIFSMQIAARFLGSLVLICLILYIFIHGEDVSIFGRYIQLYWLTTAVFKILIDCISGARLNQAVSMEHIQTPYLKNKLAQSIY